MYFDRSLSDRFFDNLDSRLVVVAKWRKDNCDSHLYNIYHKRDYGCFNGYLNFFNDNSNVMTVGDANKHLVWKMPNRERKRRGAGSINKYTTLCVYPNSEFYWCIGRSDVERKNAFRDVIRHSMNQLVSETGLPLKWVAAVQADSSSKMIAMIVTTKKIPDPETGQFRMLKKCFPPSFLDRKLLSAKNMGYAESIIARAFFECAVQSANFEQRIDNFIELSRKYNFELPLNYYPYRYLDEAGNLMTEAEKTRSDFHKDTNDPAWREQFRQTFDYPK